MTAKCYNSLDTNFMSRTILMTNLIKWRSKAFKTKMTLFPKIMPILTKFWPSLHLLSWNWNPKHVSLRSFEQYLKVSKKREDFIKTLFLPKSNAIFFEDFCPITYHPCITDWVQCNSCLKFTIFSKYQKKNLTLFYATF